MRAQEFLTESEYSSLLDAAADSLPTTYVLPQLKNNDYYLQYRFGVAIAGAKGSKSQKDAPKYEKESVWGENQFVSSIDPDVGEYVDDALRQMGMSGKKLISDKESREAQSTNKGSPIKPFKGYKK